MTGGSYAIRRDHFLHLGGYDENLLIWNGENYELSIKLWLCGGGMFEIPCSRVAHLSKVHSAYRSTEEPIDFVGRNLKRVAEVWLDDYKQYFYAGDINRYKNLDAGDLTKQFEKKKSLNCKPFKYFLEVVSPEMLIYYPITPNYFANGHIEAQAFPEKCLGMPKGSYRDPVTLVECKQKSGTSYTLTLEKSIRYDDTNDQCLSSQDLMFSNCYHQGGTQYWKFDPQTRQIINPPSKKCLESNSEDKIFMSTCDVDKIEQKWKWSYENQTALMDWNNTGIIRD